ncbi:hypothetical protein GCM10010193_39570 [Kitasatospora atroaurantiaca]|uniref:DUF6234 domain-containing protein n=1 Tax=Kitasatospora atroaurantiaca TaxID=285545 RepID=A0A561EML4_9ACTN|nr:hypothetical protein FB465_1864 [Kitasatospora atroaurantiaca]
MTSASLPTRPRTARAPWFLDLLGACAVLALETAFLAAVGFSALMAGWASHDESSASTPSMGSHALALGVLAVVAGIAAVGLFRARAPITAASQVLAAAVLAFSALAIGFGAYVRADSHRPSGGVTWQMNTSSKRGTT